VVALAGLPVRGLAVGTAPVAQQRGDLRVAHEHDVSTVAAVAAVRAGERLELLALDRDAAVAAVTGEEVQGDLVDERGHGHPLSGCDGC
jgi:hypothetical protein